MRRLLGLMLILIVILAAVGWYRGWFTLSTVHDSRTDDINVDLRIDRTKIREDASAARDRARELGDGASKRTQAPKDEIIRGTVMDVVPARRELTIRAADDAHITFTVKEDAQVELGTAITTMESLKPGTRVSVTYSVQNGINIASRIGLQGQAATRNLHWQWRASMTSW